MADDVNHDDASPLMTLYLEKRAELVRFFRLRTSSPTEAEDIVQEIYLKLAGFNAPSIENPAAYLYRLGTNVMVDRMRARRRAQARDDAYQSLVVADGEAADAPSPEHAAIARAQLRSVLAAVERFPAQRRRVFVMHKIDGLSYGEVAERLGISKSAVEKHMMAALSSLAELDL